MQSRFRGWISRWIKCLFTNDTTYRTESFDEMGPIGEDRRWDAFGPFHAYLHSAFPLVCAYTHLHGLYLLLTVFPVTLL